MAKNKFEGELLLNTETFVKSLSEADGLIGKFGKELGRMSIALGAAGAAFGAIGKWFKETAGGAEVMNAVLAVSKQMLTDVLLNQRSNIKDTIQNSEKLSKIREDDAVEGWQLAKMQKELNQLTVQSADQTLSLAEKKEVLTRAMEKEAQIKEFLIKDAVEERNALYAVWKQNITNTEAYEAFWKAAAKVEEVQGMDSRRLMSQYTGVLAEQKKRVEELTKAFQTYEQDARDSFSSEMGNNIVILNARLKDYQEQLEGTDLKDRRAIKTLTDKIEKTKDLIKYSTDLQKITAKLSLDTSNPNDKIASALNLGSADSLKSSLAPKGKAYKWGDSLFSDFNVTDEWKSSWENAIQSVTGFMADTFGDVFERIGKGSFEGFGKDLLGNFGKLLVQFGKMAVAFGSLWFAALTLKNAPTIATALAAIAAGAAAIAAGSLMVGASQRSHIGTSGGGGGSGSINAQSLNINVQGKLKGKDIYFSGNRYATELNTGS